MLPAILLGVLLCVAQLLAVVGQPDVSGDTDRSRPSTFQEASVDVSAPPSDSGQATDQETTVARTAESRSASAGPAVCFFPNPVHGSVTFVAWHVCWCLVDGMRVRLYDQSGRVVLRETSDSAQLETDGVAALPNGVYIGTFELLISGEWVQAGREPVAVLN